MGKTKTKSRSVGDSPKPPITIRSTNPKVIDDNIAKLEKAIQASDVSANPSGTAEETLLSSIGIDGKKYELGPSAANTTYDNTDSGLTATETQAAIDEIVGSLNGEEITGLTSQFIDITKVSAYKIGRFVVISINDAEVTSNMAAFETFIGNVPQASMRTLGNLAVLSAGAVVANTSCYTVSGNIGVRSLSALTSGQFLTGSITIIV